MKVDVMNFTVSEIVEGYINNSDGSVVGLGGMLNIRPSYQREFVYDLKQQRAVIDTVLKGLPLNSMYWVKCRGENDNYEVLDGQQRTLSICEFIKGKGGEGGFTIIDSDGKSKLFSNLSPEKKEKILNYKLAINICTGKDDEKMEWFKTINIAGEKLTEQEIRNAVYSGPWVNDAKMKFSRKGCPAETSYKSFLSGDMTRQDWLETAIKWAIETEKDPDIHSIEDYMAKHQNDKRADELWSNFIDIISWVQITFTNYRKEQKGLNWGKLYNVYHNNDYNPHEVEQLVALLMMDDEVTDKKGIYEYVLSNGDIAKERCLNLRTFLPSQKRSAYERQRGYCAHCGKYFDIEDMQADHIIPWSKGGKTVPDNCQVLCSECNNTKSNN